MIYPFHETNLPKASLFYVISLQLAHFSHVALAVLKF
jgi:hypothetical protein